MEGSDPQEKLRGAYWEALKKNWMLWPAVQMVNFKFVPLEHRVLVVNVVSLGELLFSSFSFFPFILLDIILQRVYVFLCVCVCELLLDGHVGGFGDKKVNLD